MKGNEMSQRQIASSFKLEVVRLVKEQGLSVSQVGESMGIGRTAIRRRVKHDEAKAM